jgi:hypothetical protein
MRFRKSIVALLTGLCLLAAASPALAVETFFEAGEYPAELKGQQTATFVFKVQGNSFECNKATFGGTQAEPSKTIDLEASFSECTAFGFTGGTVTVNTCKFRLNANSATAGVICGATPIKLKVTPPFTTCEVTIGEAGNTSLSKISNSTVATSPKTVSSKLELSGVTANVVVSTGLCPLTTGITHTATLSDTIALEARRPEGQVDFFVEAFNPPVLCATNTTPCGSVWGAGTSMRAEVLGAHEPTFRFLYEAANEVVKCQESEIQPTTDNTGVASVNGKVSAFLFRKCAPEGCSVTGLVAGSEYKMLLFRGAQAAPNGRFEMTRLGAGPSPTLTVTCAPHNPCSYVAPALLGTFSGGQPASLALDQRILNAAAGNAAQCGANLTFEDDVYSLLEPQVGAEKGKAYLTS